MAKKNYEKLAKEIVRYIGGPENVNALVHCATRLRFKVKNTQNVDKKKLEQLEGVITVLDSGGQIQVVIGQHVADVYDTIFEVTDLKKENPSDAEESGEKKNLLNTFMDTISGIFAPVLGVMSGAGMLKALLILCTTFGWLKADMGTYRILYAAADGVFTFIPVFLAYTAAKKFRGIDLFENSGCAGKLYFIRDPNRDFSICTFQTGKRIEENRADSMQNLFDAASQSGNYGAGNLSCDRADCRYGRKSTGFRIYWGFVPSVMNNVAEYGRDTLFTITGPNNMAQAGATLGVFLKTKDKSVKELAGPAALSAVLAGITEPAIYGVTLRFKRPFFIGAVFSGIAGAIVAAAGTGAPTLLGTSILTLPGYIGVGFVGFLIACAIAYFGSAIVTYFFGYSDDMLPKKEEKKEEPQEIIPAKDEALLAPVSGKVIPLSEVRDEAFAGGILGQGAAVIPENGEICAPCDGVISVMYPTGHAVGIKSDIGAEILIHVGMDTVTLNGSCFAVKVKAGDYVKAGQLLVRANIEGIKKEGLDITTPVIVANTADYMQIKTVAEESVKSGEVLLNCVSK